MRKASERLGRTKIPSTWEYWEQTPLNKRRWKSKKKKSTLKERESFSISSSDPEILSKKLNTWVSFLKSLTGSFLKLTRKKFRQMEGMKRKLKITHEVLHWNHDIDSQENKEEEEYLTFKIARIHRFKVSTTTLKQRKKVYQRSQ